MILRVILLIVLILLAGLIYLDYNKRHQNSVVTEGKFQGAVQEGEDLDYFRETGRRKANG